MTGRPSPDELVEAPEGMLFRTDLEKMGLPRRVVDLIFGRLPNVHWPGFSRPMIRAADYRAFRDEHTYGPDEVQPGRRTRRR